MLIIVALSNFQYANRSSVLINPPPVSLRTLVVFRILASVTLTKFVALLIVEFNPVDNCATTESVTITPVLFPAMTPLTPVKFAVTIPLSLSAAVAV